MATQAVLKYLKDTNRPYSANDIVQNMHKEYSKGQIQKSLDELVADGRIFEKVYGKQKVYCIKQEEPVDNVCNDEDLNQLIDEITNNAESLKTLQSELTAVGSQLKTLTTEPTTDDAKQQCEQLIADNNKLQERLDSLKSVTNLVPEEKKKSVLDKKKRNLNEYKKRKRICKSIIDEILESYPKSKKILLEDIGIDQDEEADGVLDKIN